VGAEEGECPPPMDSCPPWSPSKHLLRIGRRIIIINYCGILAVIVLLHLKLVSEDAPEASTISWGNMPSPPLGQCLNEVLNTHSLSLPPPSLPPSPLPLYRTAT
jgi:hypothetical protein